MDISETIKKYTLNALEHFGDKASLEFFQRLKNREFSAPKCRHCDKFIFPPRRFCPRCFNEDIFWTNLPEKGILYAFTQQERAIRFSKPDVIGIVDLNGVGMILTKIDAPIDSLRIGMTVQVGFIEIENGMFLHQFSPVK